MIRQLKIADYLTMGNIVSGMLSVYFAIQSNFILASIMILLGMLFDYFDGKVARWLKQTSEFGKHLDSFADIITFGVSIAIIIFLKYQNLYLGIALILFVCSGVLRLTRYNITSTKNKKPVKYFEGTPITVNGFVFPILIILNVNIYIMFFSVLLLTITMISKLKIRHL